MPPATRAFRLHCLAAAFAMVLPVLSAQAQDDALDLESAPVEKVASLRNTKMAIEGAFGNNSQRYQSGSINTQRASFDFFYAGSLGTGLRAVVSDRVDAMHPAGSGNDATVNSLREAYLSWQPGGGDTVLDFGRINVRSGPAYGYNPTDFFRDGSLRVLTSADPFAQRQNRMGSVMLRGQKLWKGGSLSAVFSPKLANTPSVNGWSLDLGSTNNRNRALVTLGTQFSQSVNSQVMLYKEDGRSATLGANVTALLSDAATAHVEWTHGSEPNLSNRALGVPTSAVTRNRFVGGVTYTTLGKTSITAEYQYNGFGLNQSDWSALGSMPGAQLAYLGEALRLQELAPRRAYLVYVTQKDLLMKGLDLTAYLRLNPGDRSKLAWLELRHHWSNYDVSLQWQQNIGRVGTEFGILPDRRIIQVLGSYYF